MWPVSLWLVSIVLIYLLFLRLGQDGVSLTMTEDLPKTRMMWAEICTGTVTKGLLYIYDNVRFMIHIRFFFFLLSALTQFFQIFSEFQSNPFYATGEVRKGTSFWLDTIRILLSYTVKTVCCLHYNYIQNFKPVVICRKVCSSDWLLHPQEQSFRQSEDQLQRSGHWRWSLWPWAGEWKWYFI